MKKIAALLLTLLMAVSITACAGSGEPAETGSPDVENSVAEEMSEPESSAAESEQENETAQPGETEETEPVPETDTGMEGTKVLVAYFSATNTTEGVAEHIANGLNADLYGKL
jgi:predicted small secreted protein